MNFTDLSNVAFAELDFSDQIDDFEAVLNQVMASPTAKIWKAKGWLTEPNIQLLLIETFRRFGGEISAAALIAMMIEKMGGQRANPEKIYVGDDEAWVQPDIVPVSNPRH